MADKVKARRMKGRAPFKVSEETRASVLEMRESGMAPADIAKKLKISTRVLKLHFGEICVSRRPIAAEIKMPPALRKADEALSAGQLTDHARMLSAAALDVLSAVASDEKNDPRIRIVAAEKVLSWAYGKPLGIGSMRPQPTAAVPVADKPEKLGKKEQLVLDAHNPSVESPMGKLMASRMGSKPN